MAHFFTGWKKTTVNSTISYPAKVSFRDEEGIETLSVKKKKRLFIFRILNTKEWLQEKEKNYTVLKYRDIYYTLIKVSIHQERYKNPEHVFSRKQSCKIFKVKTDWTERKKNRQLHNQIPTYDKTSQERVKNGLFPLDKKYLQKTYAYYDT